MLTLHKNMRISHLKYLRDPVSGSPLKLKIISKQTDHVMEGWLISGNKKYRISGGIPRLLKKSTKSGIYKDHQFKTAESFDFEWNRIYIENEEEKNNYLHFISPFLKTKNLSRKVILDAGCGSGRFTKQAALMGAKLIIGSDLGGAVTKAFDLTRDLPNVLIVQSDIYSPPFAPTFDLIQSIGVLHHLPQPQLGFHTLTRFLKKRGQMLIWVYNRRNNKRALYFYEPMRSISRYIPRKTLLLLCYVPAGIVHFINILTVRWKSPPFGYYRQFPFNMKLNDAFDVLATPKSNYYFWEEIENWFYRAGLTNIKHYEHPEAGITCIGTYGK